MNNLFNQPNPTNLATDPSRQRVRALESQESFHQTEHNTPQEYDVEARRALLKTVPRSTDLWFEDGDVILWVEDDDDSLLFRVHLRVLGDSRAEPFCTAVGCKYPDQDRPDEIFLDGIWVLQYPGRSPTETMHLIKWMYERPTISKRSMIPFAALETYLVRSDECCHPPMRRCAMEYLWNMLPTSLNYHQRVPTLVEDCYARNPLYLYQPYVLRSLALLAVRYNIIAILPLLYYYIAQWPLDWITDGVPAKSMRPDDPSPSPDGSRFPLPDFQVITILAGRAKLIQMRETKVFNFIDDFTSNGTEIQMPIKGCDGEKRKESGGTCFQWLMQLWFYMVRIGHIASPAALEVMNMGQWEVLKKNCCEACSRKVMEHMLAGRDEVWDALPGIFGLQGWEYVLERQKKAEAEFEKEF